MILLVWLHPSFTADRLLFNIIWTSWIITGTLLEERDLAEHFGDQYRDYQKRVSMLLPVPGKRAD
jgi:protein-S-isoprenylcysteine O-methyltransferase Ste14